MLRRFHFIPAGLACIAILTTFLLPSCGDSQNGSNLLGSLFEKISGYSFPSKDTPVAVPAPGSFVTEVLQPEALKAVEKQGFRLSDLFAKARFGNLPAQPYASVLELSQKNDWYLAVVQHLEREIDAHSKTDNFNIRADDDRNRLFDKRWFRSADARFELIGLVNRIDQRDFSAAAGGTDCGEVRLVYRLSYDKTQKKSGFSRLPVTFNMVFEVPRSSTPSPGEADDNCAGAANRWRVPDDVGNPSGNGAAFVDWLIKSPLASGKLKFKQLELNLQVSRIVASNKPDFGGAATYFLMIFAPDTQGKFVPTRLRNTINADAIAANTALREELKQEIKSQVHRIDSGVYAIPEKFLAFKSVSRTTHGLNRLANMPFGQVFSTSEFNDVNYGDPKLKLINSPQALLRRLDDGTCAGCHQGDSVAGFHLLGFDHEDSMHPLNTLRVGYSPHFRSEMERRSRELASLARGVASEPRRPFSFQSHATLPAKAGHRCVPTGSERFLKPAAAAELSCGQSSALSCQVLEDNDNLTFEIGTCVNKVPAAGDPCIKSNLKTNFANFDKDSMSNTTFQCNGSDPNSSYVCLQPEQGVPGGLCYRRCVSGTIANNPERELCAYNGGAAFDSCAASGDFSTCLMNGISRGLRQACDETTPCREDYICQSFFGIDAGAKKITRPSDQRGYCVPTYFIFQMRLDGHPVP